MTGEQENTAKAERVGEEPGATGRRKAVREAPDPANVGESVSPIEGCSGSGGIACKPGSHPRIPARGHYTEEARLARLSWAEQHSGCALEIVGATSLDPRKLVSNIENFVGSVEIPIGLAGPLWFNGEHVSGYITAPFATTEGALVASATRGAKAMSLAGGVNTCIIQQVMARAPAFVLASLQEARRVVQWLVTHFAAMRELALRVSRHCQLLRVEPLQLGRVVHVRFCYRTGEAAGQNMTTTATWAVCRWLLESWDTELNIKPRQFYIDANVSSDKKASMASFLQGRGHSVIADCLIPGEVLEEVLKVTPETLATFHKHLMSGTVAIGGIGHNGNVSNTVAAIFTATGQDIACTAESSISQLDMEMSDGALYASLRLPSLIVATVGGGTGLPAQKECLAMMGCGAKEGGSARLAEIIAGFALALDLSLLSAVANGQFAAAHERLGRNRPIDWFTRDDLNVEFFRGVLPSSLAGHVAAVEPIEMAMGSSILTDLAARRAQKLIGFFPCRVTLGSASPVDIVVKSKPTGQEVGLMVETMGKLCNAQVGKQVARFIDRLGFCETHLREAAIYRLDDPRATAIFPEVYFIHDDPEREAHLLGLGRLDRDVLVDTENDPERWNAAHVESAIEGIAGFHAIHYKRADSLRGKPWLGHVMSAASMEEMTPLWESLVAHALTEFEFFQDAAAALIRGYIRDIPGWWVALERMPRTLVHNDFNPRNICLRQQADGRYRLCAYDWELATVHVPQRDLAELLAFVLTAPVSVPDVERYVEYHRRCLEQAVGQRIDKMPWRQGFVLALRDYVVNRLGLYMIAHTMKHYEFLPRVIATAFDLLSRTEALLDDSARG
jgi:NADP-dependent 3-hydroxy-3-methylglutaryl-CoA reductase